MLIYVISSILQVQDGISSVHLMLTPSKLSPKLPQSQQPQMQMVPDTLSGEVVFDPQATEATALSYEQKLAISGSFGSIMDVRLYRVKLRSAHSDIFFLRCSSLHSP